MPTLTYSIDRSGWDTWHGSSSIVYTLSYNAATNKTTVTLKPSSVTYPGRNGYHTHSTTTITVKAGDNPSSSGTATLYTTGTSNTAGVTFTGTPSPASITVQHSAGPGAKTVTVKAEIEISVYPFSNSTAPYPVEDSGTRTDTSYTIPSASDISSCPSSAKTQDTISISMTRYDNSYHHVAKFKVGTTTLATSASFDTQLNYTIPRSWFSGYTNTATLNVTLSVQTYTSGGAAVGSPAGWAITVTADDNMKPIINAGFATVTANNAGTAASGILGFVQGYSKALLTLKNDNGQIDCPYNATVASYKITCQGATQTVNSPGSTETVNTAALTSAGNITITVKVTDSRGRSASESFSVTVMEYAPPTVTGVSVFQCDAGGTADEDGWYCSAQATETHASLNSQNSVTLTAQIKEAGGSYGSPETLTSGTAGVIGSGSVDPDKSHDVRITATDSLGNVGEATVTIPTRQWALKLQKFAGGIGAAFGKAPSQAKALELPADWEMYFGSEGFREHAQRLYDSRGIAIESGDDLDDYTTPGSYYAKDGTIAGSLSHTPITGGNFRLEVLSGGLVTYSNYIMQFCWSTTTNAVYTRRKHSTWSAWARQMNTQTDAEYVKASTVTSPTLAITAGSAGNVSFSVALSGYTPIGIVGIEKNGTASSYCVLYQYKIDGSNAKVYFRNVGTSDASITVTAYVLYRKNY